MIIEIERGCEESIAQIRQLAERCGNHVELTEGRGLFVTLHVIGDTRAFATRRDYVGGLEGVRKAWRVSTDYKNIARAIGGEGGDMPRRARRAVEVVGLDGKKRAFGGGNKHVFIVGPDSPQTLEQTLAIARMAKTMGERLGILDRVMLRGGAFKPRTSPTGWRGLGMKGISMLDAAREETGLPYVTEVMDHNLVSEIAAHADMLQIGTRNAQNFESLGSGGALGESDRAQAGLWERGQRVVLCGGVHRQPRQPRHRALRAWDEDPLYEGRLLSQPTRSERDRLRSQADDLADHLRSEPRGGGTIESSVRTCWPPVLISSTGASPRRCTTKPSAASNCVMPPKRCTWTITRA